MDASQLPNDLIRLIIQTLEYFKGIQYGGVLDYSFRALRGVCLVGEIPLDEIPSSCGGELSLSAEGDVEVARAAAVSARSSGHFEPAFAILSRLVFRYIEDRELRGEFERARAALAHGGTPLSRLLSAPLVRELIYVRAISLLHLEQYEEAFVLLCRLVIAHEDFEPARIAYEGFLRWHPSMFRSLQSGDVPAMEVQIAPGTAPLQVYRLRGGRVFGRRALLSTKDGVLLRESSHGGGFSALPELILQDEHALLSSLRPLESALALHASGADNFWHWIMEQLPRLLAAEMAGFTGTILVPRGGAFIKESLAILGIDPLRCLECDGEQHFSVEDLFIVDHPRREDQYALKPLYEMLRHRMLEGSGGGVGKRIYLGRTHARTVLNASELSALLDEYRFVSLDFSQLSLREQIAHIHQAEVIVAPHGAALAHLLFAPPGCTVIELFSPHYVNPCMIGVTRAFSLSYHMITALNPSRSYPHGDDIVVPVELVRGVLERAVPS